MESSFTTVSTYTPNLSVGYIFGKAIEIFKTNTGLVLGAFLIYGLIMSIPQVILGDTMGSLVVMLGAGPMALGYQGMMLKVIRNEPAEISNLFDGFQQFVPALGLYVLTAIAVGVGLLLLIVPGIIVALGIWPAFMLMYDGSEGLVETLQRAWNLTNGYKMTLFILFLITALFVLAGLIALIIGVIVTGAIGSLVYALAYEELSLSKA